MNERTKKILVVVLGAVLVVTWVLVLRPKKKTEVKTVSGHPSAPSAVTVTGSVANKAGSAEKIDMPKIESDLTRIESALAKMGAEENRGLTAEMPRDPFHPYVGGRSIVREQAGQPAVVTETTDAPTFVVSGIVYDKEKPLAIIDEEVKTQDEVKAGYLIYRILPDRVLLKKKGQTFVLRVDSSRPEFPADSGIQLSEDTESTDSRLQVLKDDRVGPAADAPVAGKPDYSLRPPDTIKTIQVASFGTEGRTACLEMARSLEARGYSEVRAECIEGVYTVRVGRFQRNQDISELYRELKEISDSAFIRTAYYIEERIIHPGEETGLTEIRG